MSLVDLPNGLDRDQLGQELYGLIAELYPICRSITGEGLRLTLRTIQKYVPLTIHEVPSGTQAFDWTVPREWNIRDAYIKNATGERIVDFQRSNLHVVNYSVPVRRRCSLAELREHLFSLPDHPDWIPYRTSYYHETWGFCLTHNQMLALKDEEYEVWIDSSLEDGHLSYGEFYLPGEQEDEVLISCHACHPSLCNDNLSGVALAALLARHMAAMPRTYSYRFLFIPGAIGSITWLSLHEEQASRIRHGLVLSCLGDPGPITYKRSRRGMADIDRAAAHVLAHAGKDHQLLDFVPFGYDERQYCSPGFNLPVGCLMRTPHGCYPQYHTSADNLDLVQPDSLADSFLTCLAILTVLEGNKTYLSLNPKCEPQLGKRGLYRAMGGFSNSDHVERAILWLLNQADGEHTLLDIAERSGLSFDALRMAGDVLCRHELLNEYPISVR